MLLILDRYHGSWATRMDGITHGPVTLTDSLTHTSSLLPGPTPPCTRPRQSRTLRAASRTRRSSPLFPPTLLPRRIETGEEVFEPPNSKPYIPVRRRPAFAGRTRRRRSIPPLRDRLEVSAALPSSARTLSKPAFHFGCAVHFRPKNADKKNLAITVD